MKQLLKALVAVTSVNAAPSTFAAVEVLPELNIDYSKITVSGVSSGGYMAQQLHMAYSDTFSAAAIIAGGPFYCAENNVGIALTRCMKPNEGNHPNVEGLQAITDYFAARGDIAALHNLTNDRVWIFSSIEDSVVYQPVSDSLYAYYADFLKPNNIRYVNTVHGEHSMPTDDFGYPCDYLGASGNPEDHFINNCGYDAAGQLLAYSYKRIKKPKNTILSGRFIQFDQSHYLADPATHGLAQYGYAYIPEQCEVNAKGKGRKCKLHVALHGCLQSADRIGRTFVDHAGYNDWADRNAIVMLYPQATSSIEQGNGNGCWDWWGYDDNDYAKRWGNQMVAVKRMIERVSAATDDQAAMPAPYILSVDTTQTGTVTIAWTDLPTAVGYAVYHSEKKQGPYYLVSADVIASNSFTTAQSPDTTGYYIVVGVAANGSEGLPSREVAISVPRILP